MRISDWSSDVCSSDLDEGDAAAFLLLVVQHVAGEALAVGRDADFGEAGGESGGGEMGADALHVLGGAEAALGREIEGEDHAEIGRASCRERGCTNGYNTLDAVCLNKKTTTKKQNKT